MPSLNSISEQQVQRTQTTQNMITRLLEYAAINPNMLVKFKASDMVLHIDIDAPYLSKTLARSHTGGYYYLISLPSYPTKAPHLLPL